MKHRVIVTVTFLLLCTWDVRVHADPRNARAVAKGEVIIFSYTADKIIVAVDTSERGADGFVDQWFVLQTSLVPNTQLPIHIPHAELDHGPGLLRVISPSDHIVYEFATTGVVSESKLPAGFRVLRTEGFGLSHNNGDTTVRVASANRRDSGCETCKVQDWGEVGGGASSTCDSGGPGSTSCSSSGGGTSCSVTCSAGYYACCTAAAGLKNCKCVKG